MVYPFSHEERLEAEQGVAFTEARDASDGRKDERRTEDSFRYRHLIDNSLDLDMIEEELGR